MDTAEKPTPPPEASLLRLVRSAAGMQAGDAAAKLAIRFRRRFSASRWSQIENGYETREGRYKRVTANAATLAQMFDIVGGVTPERLADEGQRPDAAEVLREILLHPAPAAADPSRARLEAVPDVLHLPDDPTDEEVRLYILHQGHVRLRVMMDRAWHTESIPRDQRVTIVRNYPQIFAADQDERMREREPGALPGLSESFATGCAGAQ